MKDIIKLLQDDNEYYNGVGKNYLSNSNIGDLLKNPKNFNAVQEDNKNFLVGRYFHQCFLLVDLKQAGKRTFFFFKLNLIIIIYVISNYTIT